MVAIRRGIAWAAVLAALAGRGVESGASPQVWFAPNSLPRSPEAGADALQLFAPDAPWADAAGHVQVYKVYHTWIRTLSDDQLKTVLADLERRHIALAMEVQPLVTHTPDGAPPASFQMPDLQRIKKLGGNLRYVQLDEPLSKGGALVKRDDPIHWPVERIAKRTAACVRELKDLFPDVVVGDIEPVVDNLDLQAIPAWLKAYRDATGSPMPFFIADVPFATCPDWPHKVLAVEKAVKAAGVPFGIIYRGDNETTDAAWMTRAQESIALYETRFGGSPDLVVFQSWTKHPIRCLPESDPQAFTALVNRYFGRRCRMEATRQSVRLCESDGAPVAGASVEYALYPAAGPGRFGRYALTETAPARAASALAGLRVNVESTAPGPIGSPGTCDFAVYGFGCSEGDSGPNLVPNPDFSRGLQDWSRIQGVSVEKSDRGPGKMLRVQAAPDRAATLNSERFPVKPGAKLAFTVEARVPPGCAEIGYFVLSYFDRDGKWISSSRIRLDPAPLLSGTGTTDANGEFRVDLKGIDPAGCAARFHYAGDALHWPAFGEK